MTNLLNLNAHQLALLTIKRRASDCDFIRADGLLATIRATYEANFDRLPLAFYHAEELPAPPAEVRVSIKAAPAAPAPKLLTERHKIAINGTPAHYETVKRHKAATFTLDDETFNVKITLVDSLKNHLFDYTSETTQFISQHAGALTLEQTFIALENKQLAGNTQALQDKIQRFKPLLALNAHANAHKRGELTPFQLDVIIDEIIALNFAKAIDTETARLFGDGEAFTLNLKPLLKSVNFNAIKHAEFLNMLLESIKERLKSRYELRTAQTAREAWKIYGLGSRQSPYNIVSCHDLSDRSPRTYRETENIKEALRAAVIDAPATDTPKSLQLSALFDNATGVFVARWIERARGEKLGNYARVYHSFFNDTQAERILKMYNRNRKDGAYFGAIYRYAENDDGNILSLYCDDAQNRNNIRLKTLLNGEQVLQYGGKKGEYIGKADTTSGTLSDTDNDFSEDDDDLMRCDSCNYAGDPDDFYHHNGNRYCEDCYNEQVRYCEDCETDCDAEDVQCIEVATGRHTTEHRCVCDDCISDYFLPTHNNENQVYYSFTYMKDNRAG